MEVLGTHGTCRSRYESIKQNGFKPGPGRCGTGVYLWANGIEAINLAHSWYLQENSKRKFDQEPNPNGVILQCSISFENEDQFIDFECQELKEELIKYANKIRINKNEHKDITRCYDAFVDMLSREMGTSITVYSVRVAPPNEKFSDFPLLLVGAPMCFVAKLGSMVQVRSAKEI